MTAPAPPPAASRQRGSPCQRNTSARLRAPGVGDGGAQHAGRAPWRDGAPHRGPRAAYDRRTDRGKRELDRHAVPIPCRQLVSAVKFN